MLLQAPQGSVGLHAFRIQALVGFFDILGMSAFPFVLMNDILPFFASQCFDILLNTLNFTSTVNILSIKHYFLY